MVDQQETDEAQPVRRRTFRGRIVRAVEVLSSASILFAVVAFVSEYNYRHIERTERSIQLLSLDPPQSEAAAMAIEYLNQDINVPLCPFSEICSIRPRLNFRDINLFDQKDQEGVIISRRDLGRVRIESSDLRGIIFLNANLKRASFFDTDLRQSQFNLVDLDCGQFVGSDLSGSTITFNSMNGTEFFNANISDVTFEIAGEAFMEEDEDTRELGRRMRSAGLYPGSLSGAWAWKGQEPKGLPPGYKTYFTCEPVQGEFQSLNKRRPEEAQCMIASPENISDVEGKCQVQGDSDTLFNQSYEWMTDQIDRARSWIQS